MAWSWNKEGLTLTEWLFAAGYFEKNKPPALSKKLMLAWRAGEDPSDYRLERLENERKQHDQGEENP